MPDGHIFLSYRSIEADFALKLAADLKNAGVNLWMDRLDAGIKVGDDWVQALQDALDSCFGVVAVLSPDYVESKYCRRELKRADGLGRAIYPVLLQKLEKTQWPFEIQEKQYIDFCEWRDDKAYRTQFDELIKVLRAKFPAQFSESPDLEIQYLTSLIAELESRKGVLEYVELSAQADAPKEAENVRPEPKREEEWAAGFSMLVEKPSPPTPLPQDEGRNARFGETPQKITFKSIGEAVDKFPRFVLIGEPGAGKTTTIRRLALEAARKRLENPRTAPLPLLLYLPQWGDEQTPMDFVRAQLEKGEAMLRPYSDAIEGMMARGDVLSYMDGLNEMGATGSLKAKKLSAWFEEKGAPQRVIVTCRAGDYAGELKLGETPTVLAEEMDETQIREFAERYLGEKASGFLGRVMPDDKQTKEDTRSLFWLAKNPYLLAALLFVYDNAPDGDLPRNNGALMRALARALWDRERQKQTAGWIPFAGAENQFGKLAFAMIDEDKSIDISVDYALKHIVEESLLKAGHSANLIEIRGEEVRFYHQLLQEYFAAVDLNLNGVVQERPLFSPQGGMITRWDQPIIALCGITDNLELLIEKVALVDPWLAADCVAAGQGDLSPGIRSQIVGYLVNSLYYLNRNYHFHTINALSKFGTFALPMLLNQSFSSWHQDAQLSLVNTLRRIKDSAAVPYLVDLLHSPHSSFFTDEVINTLGEIGDPRAVPVLLDILNKANWFEHRFSPEVRQVLAIRALGNIGDAAAVPALSKALNTIDHDLRKDAMRALGHIGQPAREVIPRLKRILRGRDGWEVLSLAIGLIPLILSPMGFPLIIVVGTLISLIARIEGGIGITLIVAAVWLVVMDDFAIDFIRHPDRKLRERLRLLRDQSEGHLEIREESAFALVQIDKNIALELLNDKSIFVRDLTLMALWDADDPQNVPFLIDQLGDTRKIEKDGARVCDYAAESLTRIGTPEALAAVKRWQAEEARRGGR